MLTIENNISTEIIINKSKFITDLIYVTNKDEVENHLKNIKNKHKGATHYCYAYIIDNNKRFNDDGEPGGTAGVPILNVLENKNLNYVLCVVTRYFGGIKLGAGGLVRAYSSAAKEAVEKAALRNIIQAQLIEIKFIYDNIKQIDYILKDLNIIEKKYDETITYIFYINEENKDEMLNKLNNYVLELNILKKTVI